VRRFLLILMMLWLPLQGGLAVATQLCMHEKDSVAKLSTTTPSITDNNLQNIHHESPMNDNMASNLWCDGSTICHASCSVTMLPSALSSTTYIDSFSYIVSLNFNATSFVPEQLQRPPLA